MDQDNNIWLKGKDIASALGYADTTQAIREHVEDEDKVKFEGLKDSVKKYSTDWTRPEDSFYKWIRTIFPHIVKQEARGEGV